MLKEKIIINSLQANELVEEKSKINENQTYKKMIEFEYPKCKNLVTIYITKLTI